MQIANGLLILSPENQQHVRGITPAEALILHAMHFQYSQGTPLGDFYIQDGEEALTVDEPGRAAEEEYFNQHTGKAVPARAAVPPKTHKRTNAEEIARLQRKYTGMIKRDGVSKSAFAAVFGDSRQVKLPETFAEIHDLIGGSPEHPIFRSAKQAPADTIVRDRKQTLMLLGRADVAAMALGLKLKVHAADTKEEIIGAIMAKEAKAAEKTAAVGGEGGSESNEGGE